MSGDLVREVIALEYQAAALVAAPLTSLVVAWLSRQAATHLRDRRTAAYAARLVAWAAQAIPSTGTRYAAVAAALSRRFPVLSGEQIEVLIESEVWSLKSAAAHAAREFAPVVTLREQGGQTGAAGIPGNGTGTAAGALLDRAGGPMDPGPRANAVVDGTAAMAMAMATAGTGTGTGTATVIDTPTRATGVPRLGVGIGAGAGPVG